jgi:hypothetical protein
VKSTKITGHNPYSQEKQNIGLYISSVVITRKKYQRQELVKKRIHVSGD